MEEAPENFKISSLILIKFAVSSRGYLTCLCLLRRPSFSDKGILKVGVLERRDYSCPVIDVFEINGEKFFNLATVTSLSGIFLSLEFFKATIKKAKMFICLLADLTRAEPAYRDL